MVSANETGGTLESIVYKYDVFGNLIEEDITPGGGPTTILEYALDGWNPAKMGSLGNSGNDTWAVMNGAGSLLWENVDGSGINQHLASVTMGGLVSLLLTDRQESMRGVVNSLGVVTSTTDYDAFGNLLPGTTTPTEFGYAGYRYDAAPTGLYLDNARVYDPASQRWTTRDPMEFDAGDSNLYRYVNNGPTNGVDSSGLWRESFPNWERSIQLPNVPIPHFPFATLSGAAAVKASGYIEGNDRGARKDSVPTDGKLDASASGEVSIKIGIGRFLPVLGHLFGFDAGAKLTAKLIVEGSGSVTAVKRGDFVDNGKRQQALFDGEYWKIHGSLVGTLQLSAEVGAKVNAAHIGGGLKGSVLADPHQATFQCGFLP